MSVGRDAAYVRTRTWSRKGGTLPIDVRVDYGDYLMEDPPDRLICKACQKLCLQPHLSNCCGYTFCGECTETIKSCPLCKEFQFKAIINKQALREVQVLRLICPNRIKGCEWQGVTKEFESHLENTDGCIFAEVECPADGCGKTMQRQYLRIHRETECINKQLTCKYCGNQSDEEYIINQHLDECSQFPLDCPNTCGIDKIVREDLNNHLKNFCPLEVVRCEYHDVGCHAELNRNAMEDHCKQNVAQHLTMVKQALVNASEKLSKISKNLTNKVNQTSQQYENVLQELDSATRKLSKTQEEVDGTKLLLGKSQSKVGEGLTYVESAMQIRAAELEKRMRHELNMELQRVFIAAGWATTVAWQLSQARDNQVAPVWVRMPDYINLKRQRQQWYSSPFYTHSHGYKMCLNIHPAGENGGVGSHMSVYACIMKGVYDDTLPWPMQGNLDVVILNQQSDGNHAGKTIHYNTENAAGIRVTTDERGMARGYPLFISNSQLRSGTRQFIKNGAICFQISYSNA